MNPLRRLAVVAALALPLPLSGCFIFFTTRHLPVPKAPSVVQTASPDELVALLNHRWNELHSLDATVEIQASVLKTQEGVARDYTTFRSIILMRKPAMLRVFARVPVLGTRMFDLVSDGKRFTLWIPSKNKAIEGANALHKKSASQVENLRPDFFFDAMVVKGLEPDELYSVTADSDTIMDAKKKHLILIPEYVLSVMRRKPDSNELTPVRVITFHRDDMLPYEQDLYDTQGNLETHVSYANYHDFGSGPYPTTITIKRPMEDYQAVLTVEKVTENMALNDDQFEMPIPQGTQIQSLE